MAHSIMLAAALLIGGSSEIRKASLMTVLLFDEKQSSSPGTQAAFPVAKEPAQPMIKPKTVVLPKTKVKQKAEVKTVTKLPKAQEIAPKQNVMPLAPVLPQSDVGKDSVSEATGIESPDNSSQGDGSGPSSVSGQTFGSSSGEAGAGEASASRGQTGRGTGAGADASLKQKIRDALQANLIYPYIARKRGIEGTVFMKFLVNGRGMPEGVKIVKGSSYAILDEAARETVLKASPFPAINNIIEVPIRFSLRGD